MYHKWRSYDIWFLKYKLHRQKLLSFWAIFCPFSPLTTWKIKILTLKKTHFRYYHFTQVQHKWQSYDVWFLRYQVRHNFLPLWTIFCPFNSLATQKFKILKKWKKKKKKKQQPLRYYHFTPCVPKMAITWCMVPETWSMTDRIFCHFGSFFTLLHQLQEKSKFWETEESAWRFHHFS